MFLGWSCVLVFLGKALLIVEVYIKIYRDLSLMVKYETFNLCYMGSNPIGLNKYYLGYISNVLDNNL